MNLTCRNCKYALSPIIAVILLIVVTVGLAALSMANFIDISSLLGSSQKAKGVISFNQKYNPATENTSGSYEVEVQLTRKLKGDYFVVTARNPQANYTSTVEKNLDGLPKDNELKEPGDIVIVSNLDSGDEIIVKGFHNGGFNIVHRYTIRGRS